MPISNTYSILGNDAFSVKHFVMTDIGQHVMAAESVVVLVEKPAIGRNLTTGSGRVRGHVREAKMASILSTHCSSPA